MRSVQRQNSMKSWIRLTLSLLLLFGGVVVITAYLPKRLEFDGDEAYQHVVNQVAFGPRVPGSEAHAETVNYISTMLVENGWQVTYQTSNYAGFPVINILATRAERPPILIGAHYDSRFFADQDPDAVLATQPVPGANDGASGTAVLLELSRVLPKDKMNVGLIFFDFEDQGNINGMDWIVGSRAFAAELTYKPAAVVVLDMVGQFDSVFHYEYNSNATLNEEIWETAAYLNHEHSFLREYKFSILDDHTPFVEMNIPAIDVIDFDYPYWHTSADTPDKISPKSLAIVGSTILTWLVNPSGIPKVR